jgi:hypothetical protein
LVLFNLALLVLIFVRRVVKARIFSLQDEHRFRWARVVEEVVRGRPASEPIPPLRSNWHRARAEEVLLQRWARATHCIIGVVWSEPDQRWCWGG